jgi:hypothetical protein
MAGDQLEAIVQRMIDAGESEDNIATVIQHFKATTPPPAPAPLAPRETTSALKLRGAAALAPTAADATMRLATSPAVPRTAATIGRITGAIGPAAGEVIAGNVPAGIALLGNAGKTAWSGGKAGWFTGKLLQRAAAPVASALEKLTPYAQGLSTLSGVQGVLDLAQMAEPKRRDIGFLGMSYGDQKPPDWTPAQWEQYQRDYPPLLNHLWDVLTKKSR